MKIPEKAIELYRCCTDDGEICSKDKIGESCIPGLWMSLSDFEQYVRERERKALAAGYNRALSLHEIRRKVEQIEGTENTQTDSDLLVNDYLKEQES